MQPPVQDEQQIRTILDQYSAVVGPAPKVQMLSGAGLSGSRLWRIHTAAGTAFCLRKWPEGRPGAQRLKFIHDVLRHVSSQLPIVACPVLNSAAQSFVTHVGHFWELSPWMPGEVEAQTPAPIARLGAAMRALAKFHEIAEKLHREVGPPPAIADRLRLFTPAASRELAAAESAMEHSVSPQVNRACRQLLALAKRALARDELLGNLAQRSSESLIPAIRDIHKEHVLFEGDRVSGLIDFDALRLDTPLVDLARLVGSMAGDNVSVRKAAFEHYAEVRQLTEADCRLIDLLDRLGQLGAACNWLRWLCLEQRVMSSDNRVVQRLEEIASRLQFWLINY